jgi:SAM-dependent methyltransferase
MIDGSLGRIGQEVDLLVNYPKTNRDISKRIELKTEENRKIAREFGKEFFDGDRKNGYGGFSYSPRFWQPVVPTFRDYYGLSSNSSLLDVGCAKGFMMHDFAQLIPGIQVRGIDISQYAIENAIETMKDFVSVANAIELPFESKSFDLVISINTIHNFDQEGCITALREVERVSKKNSFVVLDAYRNEEEKKRMLDWNLTARTVLHVDEWKDLFKEAGYTGDYYWFIP